MGGLLTATCCSHSSESEKEGGTSGRLRRGKQRQTAEALCGGCTVAEPAGRFAASAPALLHLLLGARCRRSRRCGAAGTDDLRARTTIRRQRWKSTAAAARPLAPSSGPEPLRAAPRRGAGCRNERLHRRDTALPAAWKRMQICREFPFRKETGVWSVALAVSFIALPLPLTHCCSVSCHSCAGLEALDLFTSGIPPSGRSKHCESTLIMFQRK